MAITQKFNLPSVLGDEAKRYRELFEKGNNRTAAGSVSFTSATSGTTYNSTNGEAGIFAQLQTALEDYNIDSDWAGEIYGLLKNIPYQAWVYSNFREQLTEQEVLNIESDPNLMAIINTYSGNNPTGTVIFVAQSTAPAGYIKANGSPISRILYSQLFNLIGTTYGSGDGSTTFNLPDLRGEFIRGFDDGRGIDTGRVMGSFQEASAIGGTSSSTSGTTVRNSDGSYPLSDSVASGSGGMADVLQKYIRPRNIALLPCIKY